MIMCKIIAFSNHKGGVGKTTSTINIGASLAQTYKVLLLDLDPQANLTQSLVKDKDLENISSIYDYIKEFRLRSDDTLNLSINPLCIKSNLYVIPATLDLTAAEIEICAETGRERIINEILSEIKKDYDYILIDCPPSLGILTINALSAADLVVIPTTAEYLPMRGLAKLTEVVKKIKSRINNKLDIGCVFLTKFDSRKILNREILEKLKQYFGNKLMETKISVGIVLAEAPSQKKDIFSYNEASKAAKEYDSLTQEILEKVLK